MVCLISILSEDFKLKINSDLVGKLANLCSRSQGFIHKYNQGVLADKIDEGLWNNLLADHQQIRQAYEMSIYLWLLN